MKKIFFLFAIVMTLTTVALTSCDSSEDIVNESVQDLPDAELTRHQEDNESRQQHSGQQFHLLEFKLT